MICSSRSKWMPAGFVAELGEIFSAPFRDDQSGNGRRAVVADCGCQPVNRFGNTCRRCTGPQTGIGRRVAHILARRVHGRLLPGLLAETEVTDQREPVLLAMNRRQPHLLESIAPLREPKPPVIASPYRFDTKLEHSYHGGMNTVIATSGDTLLSMAEYIC